MIFNILKGAFVGAANVVPGVSGGTIAFILGIYDYLTEAIAEFFTCTKEKRKEYFVFLLQIGIGVLLGIALFAKIVSYLYEYHPEPTSFFFIGLIIASLPIILKENKGEVGKVSVGTFFIGFVLVIFLSKMNNEGLQTEGMRVLNFSYSLKLYFCGTIAAGAMVIPGISGSLLLLLLGEYYNVLNFINNREILPLIIIGFGVVTGILFIAKIIDFLLKKHKNSTIFFILGLIIASIYAIWPGFNIENALLNILSIIFGIGLVYFSKKLKKG